MDFRCTAQSNADLEQMVGTAPTDQRWLFVEEPGPWGAKPLTENRLPQAVKDLLMGLDGMQVQLIRHHGRTPEHPPVVLAATVHPTLGGDVATTVFEVELPHIESLLDLDLDSLFYGTHPDARPVSEPLWFICTNGKRDRCCSEIGRPIADVLEPLWPVGTWETTHLGGHRFSGTLLALPSGHVLGRLTPENVLAAAETLLAGYVPFDLTRGRVGLGAGDQVLDLHLLSGGSPDVDVVSEPGPARQLSCGPLQADVPFKPTRVHRIVAR